MKRALVAAIVATMVALAPRAASGEPDTPDPRETVVGISVRDFHRAYPTALFSTRRVVNDVIGDMEVAVFHDPALGLSSAWFRMVFGEPIEFSGEAAGTVADDLTTITRWDLATGEAVGGSLHGQRLVPLDVTTTSWAGWAGTHPNAEVFREER